MDELVYIGELLWPRELGRILIILSFITTIFSAYSFFQANRTKDAIWSKMGKIGFYGHTLSTYSAIALIFTLMIWKRYEYSYVQSHVSDDLPMSYILSAFWEGQEGSFLLWAFWHIILGWFIVFKKHELTNAAMGFLMMIQGFIIAMLLGIHVDFGFINLKLGSSPFTLLRDTMDIPIFRNANYVSLVKGVGLNPLLQNYWNIIHPPVMFLGFASLSIPYAYVCAALLNKSHQSWIKVTYFWGISAATFLGIGILMGSAWAYEALNFGGYWNWDPVENTSFVPWLTIIAGFHAHLIAMHTRRHIKTSYALYIVSFILIVYSTTLTRSGILGDTSNHAFTEMGLETQLFIWVSFLIGLSTFLYFRGVRNVVKKSKEESIASREFWMFIGSIILLLSSLMITASTSLPVFNKVAQYFNESFVAVTLEDPIAHYNKYQLWVAVCVALLSGLAIFFQYNKQEVTSSTRKALKALAILTGVSILATVLLNMILGFVNFSYIALTFASIFGILCNVYYILFYTKNSNKNISALVAHAGLSLMFIGILSSSINKYHISVNRFMFGGLMDEEKVAKNVQLIKGKPMFMSNYWVTYKSDSLVGRTRYFDLHFKQIDENENVIDEFNVHPNVLYANDFSKVAALNPDTKRYFFKDVFTHIAGLPAAQMDQKFAKEMEDTLRYDLIQIPMDQWTPYNGTEIRVSQLGTKIDHPAYKHEPGDIELSCLVEVRDTFGKTHTANPGIALRSSVVYKYYEQINDVKSRYRLNETSFESAVKANKLLNYQPVTLQVNEQYNLDGVEFTLKAIQPISPDLIPNADSSDIAVQATLHTRLPSGEERTLEPKFIIRNNKIIPIRDQWINAGIYAVFDKIDPETGMAYLQIAKDDEPVKTLGLEIAKDVPRSDVIVLEATIFPGINFFWLGSILMLLGIGIRLFYKKVLGN